MSTPSRTPSQLTSRRPSQSKTASASQVPLPASTVPDSKAIPSAAKLPGATETRRIGQSIIPRSLAFRSGVPGSPQTRISSASQADTPSRISGERKHSTPIAGLPSIAESVQTLKGSNVGGSIIRLPGGRTMTSKYTKPEDVTRAEKQLSYATLPAEERAEQDVWANEKGKNLAPCPNNLSWLRLENHQGYQCSGGMHYIPDMLIAEGVPACIQGHGPRWIS